MAEELAEVLQSAGVTWELVAGYIVEEGLARFHVAAHRQVELINTKQMGNGWLGGALQECQAREYVQQWVKCAVASSRRPFTPDVFFLAGWSPAEACVPIAEENEEGDHALLCALAICLGGNPTVRARLFSLSREGATSHLNALAEEGGFRL
ncbi:hypothetical protein CYMTET_9392 [Cymbomonas tetramitiformis]|uniref:Uncharacterized protein n=1 Tax=Cymbomonas tetramitiformis TaxID=36881 RepID=A0AAE0LFI7_9CHLO|nr:hypothetical protein CYMTET_9392 [Cymbomonas tetramitiformis]